MVAITGLLGSGKSRLAEVIFGHGGAQNGAMRLDGAAYAPARCARPWPAGVFMSPKDRATNAVIPGFDIANNMTLPFLSRVQRRHLF